MGNSMVGQQATNLGARATGTMPIIRRNHGTEIDHCYDDLLRNERKVKRKEMFGPNHKVLRGEVEAGEIRQDKQGVGLSFLSNSSALLYGVDACAAHTGDAQDNDGQLQHGESLKSGIGTLAVAAALVFV